MAQDPTTAQAMAQRTDIPTPLHPEQWSGNPYNDSYTQQMAKQEMQWHMENNPGMGGGANAASAKGLHAKRKASKKQEKPEHVVLNGGRRVYVVKLDSTKKKFINKNKEVVYLSSIRGKYRYVK